MEWKRATEPAPEWLPVGNCCCNSWVTSGAESVHCETNRNFPLDPDPDDDDDDVAESPDGPGVRDCGSSSDHRTAAVAGHPAAGFRGSSVRAPVGN